MKEIRFNAQYGRRADFLGIIPADYLVWWAGIMGMVMIPSAILRTFEVPVPLLYYGLIPLGWTLHVLALGKRPYATLSQFYKPKKEVVSYVQLHPSKTKIKPRVQASYPLIDLFQKQEGTLVEDEYDLSALIAYDMGEEVGALFLESGSKCRLVFAFECDGIATTTTAEACNEIAERLDRGLRDFQRKGESFTIRASTFSECSDRVDQLERIIEKSEEEYKFLFKWEQKMVKFLTKEGRFQPKKLIFYLTYTIDNRFEPQANLIQTLYAFCESLVSRTTEPVSTRFEKILREGFRQGYRGHQRYLKRIGFQSRIRPLTYQELYRDCWKKVREGEPDHIPVYYRFTRSGLSGPIRESDFSLLAHLFNKVPVVKKKSYAYLPGKGKFVGVAVLNSRPTMSWEGDQRKKQLEFAMEALFDGETRDTEICFQLTPEDPQEAIRRANRLANQGDASQRSAQQHGRRNRAAEFATEESDDADKALRRGSRVVRMSLVLLVYRNTAEELELAMNALEGCDCFGGQILARDREYASKIWSDTLPFTYRDQLTAGGFLGLTTSEFDRRISDTTQACLAYAPLLKDVSPDQNGLMFISPNGRTPLYLNLLKERPWPHMIVSAYTGHGKSVLIAGLVSLLRSQEANITIFDADIGDGQGSYRRLLDYAGGAYFSPAKHKSNLFEGGDWRSMEDVEKRTAAQATFKNFLVSALSDLSISDARDILSLLVSSFLSDPDIMRRRDLAFDGGLGSSAWEQFPTIKDFLKYATLEHLPEEFQNERQERILTDCKARLRAKLALPEGEAISHASTFPTDCPLTVASLGSAATSDDALPTVLATQANFLRMSLSSTNRSYLLADEISRIRRFSSIDNLLGDMFSRGRKLGVSCIAIGQDLDGLQEMKSANDIFKNSNIYLTGHIESGAEGMVARGIPKELIAKCESSEFLLPRKEMASRWLLSCSGNHLIGDFYPNPALFALAMNQKSEIQIKQSLNLSGDKYQQLLMLTKHMMKGTIYEQGKK